MGEPITQKHLEQYLDWKMCVELDKERLARAEHEAMWPTAGESSGSQHQPGKGDRMERAVIRKVELDDEVLPRIRDNERKMKQIRQAINALDDLLEQEVLRLTYIDGGWDEDLKQYTYKPAKRVEVGLKMHRNEDWAKKVHKQAIQSIGRFIFEE